MVQKLFERIRQIAQNTDCLCFVLLDGALQLQLYLATTNYPYDLDFPCALCTAEVESLSASRTAAAAGTEPSDGERAKQNIVCIVYAQFMYVIAR